MSKGGSSKDDAQSTKGSRGGQAKGVKGAKASGVKGDCYLRPGLLVASTLFFLESVVHLLALASVLTLLFFYPC